MTTVHTEDLIRSALIAPSLEATSKDAVLEELLELALASGRVPGDQRDATRTALFAREAVGSTGIGNGVAVPHMKSPELEDLVLVFGRSEAGLAYQAVDGRDVHLVFMVLAPDDEADRHLQVLRWVSTLARNEDFRRFALQTDSEEGLRDLLLEMGTGGV